LKPLSSPVKRGRRDDDIDADDVDVDDDVVVDDELCRGGRLFIAPPPMPIG
jgi:hypothetical protein